MDTIDLFAGFGGNTLGANMVSGVNVKWAANHNPMVINFHEKNHPDIEHSCQDLQQADWSLVPSHDFMMASPCCQGHTNARGKEG
jgi:DNA (cytosine-5)-methyltransferase 1